MKRLSEMAVVVIALTLMSLPASALAALPESYFFSNGALSFDYRGDLWIAKRAAAAPDLESTQKQELPLDMGTVTGTNYVNKYFGLTLTIPADWTVQEADLNKQMAEKGKELVTSDDPATKRALDQAADNTRNLLTISERPIGSPGPFNSIFICGAETLPAGVKTDLDYLLVLKGTLKYAQAPTTMEKDIYSEQFGGVRFYAVDYKIDFSGVIVKQKYYAHIMKNYALFFVVTYMTDEQLKTQTGILRSAVFQ